MSCGAGGEPRGGKCSSRTNTGVESALSEKPYSQIGRTEVLSKDRANAAPLHLVAIFRLSQGELLKGASRNRARRCARRTKTGLN